MSSVARVSVHGGHSGAFCCHAVDSLEAVVQRYIALGFEWMCLTEHMPTENHKFIAPEERQAGFDVDSSQQRFACYFKEARRLTNLYEGQIEILTGFETEAYSGYQAEIVRLIAQHQPQMLVGSVHHVNDVLFDASPAAYQQAADLSGGIEKLYCDYFDTQLDLIEAFEPAVVGHFDLIRLHDPNYLERWAVPAIEDRALRNLQRIKELGLILDLNARALAKGASEPYVSKPWLEFAIREGIALVPGDDSHGVENVGGFLDETIARLQDQGGSTTWKKPSVATHKPHP